MLKCANECIDEQYMYNRTLTIVRIKDARAMIVILKIILTNAKIIVMYCQIRKNIVLSCNILILVFNQFFSITFVRITVNAINYMKKPIILFAQLFIF